MNFIKEVRKDDIVEQIFTIKTNTAIIDNPQNYTIKQNNDKFNIGTEIIIFHCFATKMLKSYCKSIF